MKFLVCWLAALVVSTADAFVVSSPTRTNTQRHLIPPRDINDVTEHAQEIYDANVQKTYG